MTQLPALLNTKTLNSFNSILYLNYPLEKHKENFEDTAIWGPLKERIALYVLLELGLVRDYAEKRKLINPIMPGSNNYFVFM